MSIGLSVCPLLRDLELCGLETSGFFLVLNFLWGLGACRLVPQEKMYVLASLLCIVEELAGGRSVAVAVGVGDR